MLVATFCQIEKTKPISSRQYNCRASKIEKYFMLCKTAQFALKFYICIKSYLSKDCLSIAQIETLEMVTFFVLSFIFSYDNSKYHYIMADLFYMALNEIVLYNS